MTLAWCTLLPLLVSCKYFKKEEPGSTNSTASSRKPLILMYHDVLDLSDPADKAMTFESGDVSKAALESHLKHLKQQGYTTLSSEEVYKIKKGEMSSPAKAVHITFDDGYLGQYKHAVPLLEANNQKATFFVHTAYVGVGPKSRATASSGNLKTDAERCLASSHSTAREHMDWDHLRDLEARGLFDVQSHTVSHLRLSDSFGKNNPRALSEEQQGYFAKVELECSRRALEMNLHGEHAHLAYPFGAYNAAALLHAKNFYKAAHAIRGGIVPGEALHQILRIDIGKNSLNLETFKCRIARWERGDDPASC